MKKLENRLKTLNKQKLIGNLSKGLIFVFSAPAGTGKTTLVRMLKEEFSSIEESVSTTTRAPRVGEENGKDYWFVSEAEFKESIAAGEFLEHSEVFGNMYGISNKQLQKKPSRNPLQRNPLLRKPPRKPPL